MPVYRGPLLDGVDVVDSAFEHWLEPERHRIHRGVLDALRRLSRAQLAMRSMAEAEITASRIAELDPICEECHRALMQILMGTGTSFGPMRVG